MASFRISTRADGDFADVSRFGPEVTWLRQVHGANVVVVTGPGEHAGEEADAAITDVPGCTLAVRTADCVPVIVTSDRVAGVVHAGWRGLMAGVVENTVAAIRDLDPASGIAAIIGPHIGPECYEFGAADLDVVASRYGDSVRGTTRLGTPALDLGRATVAALSGAGVTATVDRPTYHCTACAWNLYFSWRARHETERLATRVFL